jgi:tetrameric-type glycyl-tRNA synthetase beta subunit
VEENVYLVEQPRLLLGGFPESFLRLPAPVLVSAMKKHEKFFPVVDGEGALLPHFISVYNNGDPDKVREGNEWVLVARFNDAAFFFEEDRKQPLEAFVPALGRILYQQKLGALLDKAHRLERVAEQLAGALDWDAEQTLLLHRAARLCKADLATQMVMEFPDLQGVIGAEYARMSGEPEAVATAIGEHYMPRHAGDPVPESPLGRALAVLDRIDALVGYVGLGYLPKGSSDPFGLRRAAAGVVEILQHEPDYPTLAELVQRAHDAYRYSGRRAPTAGRRRPAAGSRTRLVGRAGLAKIGDPRARCVRHAAAVHSDRRAAAAARRVPRVPPAGQRAV